MPQIIQVDLTMVRFLIMLFVLLISSAGIFIGVGKLLGKQKTNCNKIKVLNSALWDKGRPILQSVKSCEKINIALSKELNGKCDEILGKLDTMDRKRDEAREKRDKQLEAIRLHLVQIDPTHIEKIKL